MRYPITPCARPDCREPGHVVLYAVGGELDGTLYRPDEPIIWCLKHGGEIYDAIHHRRTHDPKWICDVLTQGARLPRVRGAYHNRPNPVSKPVRPSTPKRPWSR